MHPVKSALALLAVVALATTADAQAPLAFQPGIEPPSRLAPELRRAIEERAAGYPFEGFRTFGTDSVLLVFSDSAVTGDAFKRDSWMFGPPVTAAEADSCPPQKVLGRRLARIYWRGVGKPAAMKNIMVAVHGTVGIDRWTVTTLYYTYDQLAGAWIGDAGRQ
jgi:hypothetical protein